MAAGQLDDTLIMSRISMHSDTFKYYQKPKVCYSIYLLKAGRSEKSKSEPEVVQMEDEDGESSDRHDAPKRRKQCSSSSKGGEVEEMCYL